MAGDLHGAWGEADEQLLALLRPDLTLFVGDLSDGDLRLTRRIAALPCTKAVILGNHDRGGDRSGGVLRQQLSLLGEHHCGWTRRTWDHLPVSIVGARPCSAGGGFHLSKAVQAVYGPVDLETSVERIVSAAAEVPDDQPLIVMAHCGPTGLGSDADSICGRDWKKPAVDWGDQDLALALDRIRERRCPDLVVFGHMHHALKRGSGVRRSLLCNRQGTAFLNAACVPRCGINADGVSLMHLSWAEFSGPHLRCVAHRWYSPDGVIRHQEQLTLPERQPC
ncbi:MAG: TIGR04168 family protein [Synechococcus sp.]